MTDSVANPINNLVSSAASTSAPRRDSDALSAPRRHSDALAVPKRENMSTRASRQSLHALDEIDEADDRGDAAGGGHGTHPCSRASIQSTVGSDSQKNKTNIIGQKIDSAPDFQSMVSPIRMKPSNNVGSVNP